MDIDELRIVSQQKPQKNVNITELATYIGSGVIVLASLGFLGYSYVTANQAPQQVAYAATETAKKASSRSIDMQLIILLLEKLRRVQHKHLLKMYMAPLLLKCLVNQKVFLHRTINTVRNNGKIVLTSNVRTNRI